MKRRRETGNGASARRHEPGDDGRHRATAGGVAGSGDLDRGAATILVLALGLVLVAAGLAGASIGSARVARHQAHTAADLGALAGAAETIYGQPVACARAEQLVSANGGAMTTCVVDGLEITVHVQVVVRPMPGLTRHAEAAARAGPVSIPIG